MTGQPPVAIARLIKRTPSLRATSNDDATAMAVARGQRDPRLYSWIYRQTRQTHLPGPGLPVPAQRAARWRSLAGPLFGGISCVYPQPTAELPGPMIRTVRSGTGERRWKGYSRLRSRRLTRGRRTDRAGAGLAGRGLIPYAYHRKYAG